MPHDDRQRVERVVGARRARLTAAPGTSPESEPAEPVASADPVDQGPNDDRMRREVPPHY